MSDINLKGFDALQTFMKELPVKVEKNVARGTMRAAANVVKDEAKAQLAAHGNVVTGELASDLKVSTSARGGVVKATLRVKGKHAFVAYWLEFTGAVAHVIRVRFAQALHFGNYFVQDVLHPGFHAKPFLRPALDSKAQAALVAAGEYAKQRLATKHGLDTADIEIGAS